MRILTLFVATGIVAVMACGGKGADGARIDTAASDTPASDGATSGGAAVEEFTLACMAHSNLDRPICECAGKKADAELTDDGLALLTAMLRQNEGRANELRARLDGPEIVRASTFMVHGPAQCAAERAGLGQ